MSLFNFILVCWLLFIPVYLQNQQNDQNQPISLTLNYPPHIYKISCNESQFLNVQIQWQSEFDLKACVMKYGTNLLGDECLMTFSSISGYNLQFSYSIAETSFYFIRIDQLTSNNTSRFEYNIAYFTSSSANATAQPSSSTSPQKVSSQYRQYANDLSSPLKYKATSSSSSSSSSSDFKFLQIVTTFISPSDLVATFSSSNGEELCIQTLVAETGVWLLMLEVTGIFGFLYDILTFAIDIKQTVDQYCTENQLLIAVSMLGILMSMM